MQAALFQLCLPCRHHHDGSIHCALSWWVVGQKKVSLRNAVSAQGADLLQYLRSLRTAQKEDGLVGLQFSTCLKFILLFS